MGLSVGQAIFSGAVMTNLCSCETEICVDNFAFPQ